MTTATYANIKAQLATAGFPTSATAGWNSIDQTSYNAWRLQTQLATGAISKIKAQYGFAFPAEMPIQITGSVTPPTVANFTSVITGLKVAFTDTSTNSPTSWLWDFGDGTTSTLQNPTHVYATAGGKSVSLKATNPNGTSAPMVKLVTTVAYSGTLAGTPLSGAHPLSVTYTLTESNGAGTSFAWTFGDATTATTTVPTAPHSYAAAGSFTASVVATVNGVAQPSITAAAPVVVS